MPAALEAIGQELSLVGDHVAQVQRQLEALKTSIMARLDTMEEDMREDRKKLSTNIIDQNKSVREITDSLHLQNAMLERLLAKP